MAKKSIINGVQILTHENHLDVTLCLAGSGYEDYYTEVSLTRGEYVLAFGAAGIRDGRSRYNLLPSPVKFWLPELPRLYNLEVQLFDKAGSEVEGRTVRMGFRDVHFCADGFFLNGRMICPAVMDLRTKATDPEQVKFLKQRWDINLVLCRIDRNTDAFLTECDKQGRLAALLLTAGYGRLDISRAILRLGFHPALCAWVVEEIGWGKTIAPQLAQEDPSRALLHLDCKTGNALIFGGKGERTRMAGGIKLVG